MTTQENLRSAKLKTTTLDTETHLELRQQLKQLKHDSSNSSQNNEFQEKELPMDGLLPATPPLSSRGENHYSKDGSPKNDNAPEIPPSDLPPPIPPRKFQNINATLPRRSAIDRDEPRNCNKYTIPWDEPTINVSSGQDSVFDSLPRSVKGLRELRPRITAEEGKQNFFI